MLRKHQKKGGAGREVTGWQNIPLEEEGPPQPDVTVGGSGESFCLHPLQGFQLPACVLSRPGAYWLEAQWEKHIKISDLCFPHSLRAFKFKFYLSQIFL